jgi:hypothetical protein
MPYTQTVSATGWSARSDAVCDLRALLTAGGPVTDQESKFYKAAFARMQSDPRACAEDCIYAAQMALLKLRHARNATTQEGS